MHKDDRKIGVGVIGAGRAGMIHARNFARGVSRGRLAALVDAHAPHIGSRAE